MSARVPCASEVLPRCPPRACGEDARASSHETRQDRGWRAGCPTRQAAQGGGGRRPRLWIGQPQPHPSAPPGAPSGVLRRLSSRLAGCTGPDQSLPLRGAGCPVGPPAGPGQLSHSDGNREASAARPAIQAVLGYEYLIRPCRRARLHLQPGGDRRKERDSASSASCAERAGGVA